MKFSELLTPDEFKEALMEGPDGEVLTEVLQDLTPYRDIVGRMSTIRRKEAYEEVCMVLVSIAAALEAKDLSERKEGAARILFDEDEVDCLQHGGTLEVALVTAKTETELSILKVNIKAAE